jgi:hypothetical protein
MARFNPNMMSAMFDITEKPIREWLARQIDRSKSMYDIFGDGIQTVRSMEFSDAPNNKKYTVTMVCDNLDCINMEERKKLAHTLSSFCNDTVIHFGRILHAYITSINMVYSATMASEDQLASHNLGGVKFQLDQTCFLWRPNDECKTNDVLMLDVKEIDMSDRQVQPGVSLNEFIADVDVIATTDGEVNISARWDTCSDEEDEEEEEEEDDT